MMGSVAHEGLAEACAEFCRLVQARIGIRIRPDQHPDLGRLIMERTRSLALSSAEAYCARLARESVHGDEFTRIVCTLTNPHTYFYRDVEQLAVLQHLGRAIRASGRPLTVWCAGCATGEEAYSVAMYCLSRSIDVRVLGTDINPEAVAAAEAGQYREWSLRRLASDARHRFFIADGGLYRVGDLVRRHVELRRHNLVGDAPPAPPFGTSWDVIFCRNVLVYFDRPTVEEVVRSFATVLAPTGFLVPGIAESLYRLDVPYEMVEVGQTLVYRHGTGLPRIAAPADSSSAAAGTEPAAPFVQSPAWSRAPSADAPAAQQPSSETERYDAVTALLARGDRAAAESELQRILEADPTNLQAQLTLANLQLLEHSFDAAIALYQEALLRAPLLAEAHYLLGVVYRKVGDLERAARVLQAALFLEPRLWCASFLLAGVQRRLGRVVDCRRNLLHTLSVLDEAGANQAFISFTTGMQDVELSRDEVQAVCRRLLPTLGRTIE